MRTKKPVPDDVEGFAADFRINSIPQTIVVGRGGEVREAWRGALSDAHLEQL